MKKFNNLLWLGLICCIVPVLVGFILLSTHKKGKGIFNSTEKTILYDTVKVEIKTYDTIVIKKYVYDTIRKKTPKKIIVNDSIE